MAEKEERIAVAKMIVNTDDEGSAKLGHFKIYSSQEAIKKISSHLLMCDMSTMDTDEIAEAALNALLRQGE